MKRNRSKCKHENVYIYTEEAGYKRVTVKNCAVTDDVIDSQETRVRAVCSDCWLILVDARAGGDEYDDDE